MRKKSHDVGEKTQREEKMAVLVLKRKKIGFMIRIVENRSKLRLRIFQWNPVVISDNGLK